MDASSPNLLISRIAFVHLFSSVAIAIAQPCSMRAIPDERLRQAASQYKLPKLQLNKTNELNHRLKIMESIYNIVKGTILLLFIGCNSRILKGF
jgi:hypothetical protein